MNRKLRMGMVGGGKDAFIGAIHRAAALMDNRIELVCGCFSANREVSLESGREQFIEESRIYPDYKTMFEREAALPEDVRMDFVTIVTPNHLHYEPAVLALRTGFDVVLDKPIAYSLEQALSLREILKESGRTLALTHVYSGYPAIKEAKMRIARGDFGVVRKIFVEYPQGWLAQKVEDDPRSNAGWRTDPARSGKAGTMGDIGTHAMHLAEYVTGLRCEAMCADLMRFVPGRRLDDDGAALLRFNDGARGVLVATQIAAGEENPFKIRVYGERGGVEWMQMEPNTLIVKWNDKPAEIVRVGNGYMGAQATHCTRIPAGHPEGFIEAFANIYRNFAHTALSRRNGVEPEDKWLDFPGVEDGIRGMQFIETIVKSGYEENKKWVEWVCQ